MHSLKLNEFEKDFLKKALISKAWESGNLDYLLHDGQMVIEREFKKVKNKLFVGNCSRRFGKTFWIAKIATETANKKPNSKVKIASAFLKDIEEFIEPAFDFVLNKSPEELRPQYKESKKKYYFNNGSEIQLIGLDKRPDGGRGNYCDLYIFDEAAFIKNVSYIYSSVVVPQTMYRNDARIVMMSTPPKSPDHDFKDFVIKAKRENAYCELNIFKNPMVTPQMITEYKAECLTETDWLREYMCQLVVDQTLAIIPEFINYNFKREDKNDNYKYYHKYVSMDLGVRDFNVTVFGYYDFLRAKLVIEREHVINGPQMTTPKLKHEIEKIEKELWEGKEPYKRVADNNNPLLLLDLGSIHGMFFHSTTKDNLHAMVNNLRVWFQQGRIEIDDSCSFLIDSLAMGLWNEKRSEFGRSKALGHYDGIASLMYLVRNIDESTNPIPNRYTFDQLNTEQNYNELRHLGGNFEKLLGNKKFK